MEARGTVDLRDNLIKCKGCKDQGEVCNSMGRKRGMHSYLSTIKEHQNNSLESLFETLDDWTKPKADKIAAFTQLQALNQGNKTLSEFILEVRRLAELCNLACNGDIDKLIRNCIVAGITSTKAYQQCISKGSSLTLSECIKICQMEDTTHRQVQILRPEIQSQPELQDCPTPVHRVNNFHHPQGRSNCQRERQPQRQQI